MKKILRITTILVVTFITILFSNKVFALSDIKDAGDSFISQGSTSSPITTQEAWDTLKPIAQILIYLIQYLLKQRRKIWEVITYLVII